ncbi:MAG: lytic transglycosylase domain-containing protein [Thioalkalivibrio sp.]|nr:lytic transglycosylase domain-containing protein [Thioalkalivibrio sp.]
MGKKIRGAWKVTLALTLSTPVFVGVSPLVEPRAAAPSALDDLLAHVEARAGQAELEAQSLEEFYAVEMAPMVDALMALRGRADRPYATRIAVGLMREGRRTDIDPRLLLAVMTVENPWLDLAIRSPMGAVGLMQVMPFHAGNWGCESDDLEDLDANICHGAEILANALVRTNGDLNRALLRYNGCVRGTNTPDCHLYPSWVLRHPELAAMGM